MYVLRWFPCAHPQLTHSLHLMFVLFSLPSPLLSLFFVPSLWRAQSADDLVMTCRWLLVDFKREVSASLVRARVRVRVRVSVSVCVCLCAHPSLLSLSLSLSLSLTHAQSTTP